MSKTPSRDAWRIEQQFDDIGAGRIHLRAAMLKLLRAERARTKRIIKIYRREAADGVISLQNEGEIRACTNLLVRLR